MYEATSPLVGRPESVPSWNGAAPPSPGWRRLLWAEDLRRRGRQLDVQDPDWPWHWLDDSTPGIVEGPPEGTLDELSWSTLVEVVAEVSAQGAGAPCRAYVDALPAQDLWAPRPHVWAGPLGDIVSLVSSGEHLFSPTNWWLEDRSWFVYTDYDSSATKVGGSEGLVRALEAAPGPETIRWTGPGGRGGRDRDEWMRANPYRREHPLP